MTGRHSNRIMGALVCAGVMLAAGAAGATITTREQNDANPRGWSAVAGMDTRAVREMARTLPRGPEKGDDRPWCDRSDIVAQTLRHDFAEKRIAVASGDTVLWGSEVMGTWTMVLDRPDATSCVIASGVGFRSGENPQDWFVRAGLTR